VPEKLAGCHTMLISGYVVEGHVPVGAINKLLTERPRIKGTRPLLRRQGRRRRRAANATTKATSRSFRPKATQVAEVEAGHLDRSRSTAAFLVRSANTTQTLANVIKDWQPR
jgi:hypothetical protein